MRRILLLSLGLLISHGSMADSSLWTDLENHDAEIALRGGLTSERYNYSRYFGLADSLSQANQQKALLRQPILLSG